MQEKHADNEARVKRANRQFYDLAASVYEKADGRRNSRLASYLRDQISRLYFLTTGRRVLDLGTGSGFAASVARERFPFVVGADISPRILSQAVRRNSDCVFLCADSDSLPFADNTFDCVISIAVMHHLLRFDSVLCEIHRVLKPGGVLYTDHDIERLFCRFFRIPLSIFRIFRDEEKTYRNACPELTRELYKLSEIHRDGVDVELLQQNLMDAGFRDCRFYYHWNGLSGFFDRAAAILSPRGCGVRGFAPSVSIWARKQG